MVRELTIALDEWEAVTLTRILVDGDEKEALEFLRRHFECKTSGLLDHC